MNLPCWNRTNYLPDYSRMLYQSELRVVPRDSEGAIGVFAGCKRSGHRGARTPDPGLIRPMLYRLSYQSESTAAKQHVCARRGARTEPKWSIGVSIPVPRACKARTLPIELMPLL